MSQDAYTGNIECPAGVYTLISEGNCTFIAKAGQMEFLAGGGVAPSATIVGAPYPNGMGQEASFDALALFPGEATRTHLYAISRVDTGLVWVSRAAVA
jgi:hypothetical protein